MQILMRLNDHFAIGHVNDPPQWTLMQSGRHKGKEVWHSVSWCQTSEALRRAVREKVVRGRDFYPAGGAKNLPITDEAERWLADLPPKIES